VSAAGRLVRTLAVSALALAPAAARAATLPPDLDPLVRNLDPAARPGDDFAAYAWGTWLRQNPIPASERGWGIGNLVNEQVYAQLRAISEEAARGDAPAGSSARAVGDFWRAGMDSARVEAQGLAPLAEPLGRIAATRDAAQLAEEVARLQAEGIGALYSMYVGQDARNSARYVVHLNQGGLGLPDRGYYFDDDSTTRHVRGEYAKHVAATFRLLGEDARAAARSSAAVIRIETALAARSRTLEERRDPWANYHKRAVARLDRETPALRWPRQLAVMGLAADSVVIGQPEFFARADSLVRATPLADLQAYLRWNLARRLAPRLGRAFELESFRFYGAVMNGAREQRPRWKRVLDAAEDGIGELLGQEWVKRHCSPATKARYERLTQDVFAVYRERIRALPWMSPATKERALAKLDRVVVKVGYPERWRDYSALRLSPDSYAANQLAINRWWFRYEASKLGKPIDRHEWWMTPQTYNAYYDGSKVEIVMPAAAFMIPGVPDSLLDDAILYSYAGAATIGHEITHGFDDEGRQSDADGNLNPWWTAEDSIQFTRRAERLVAQFDRYEVAGKRVRGRATLGENIADLGGVVLGYEAFKRTEQWKRGEKLNGLTPDQRYFLGWALGWMGQRRPEALAQLIMTDVHAPQFLRVNGPLANLPAFHAAFGVKPGDAMWRAPEDRVEIW
jgi:putative endopeptidase